MCDEITLFGLGVSGLFIVLEFGRIEDVGGIRIVLPSVVLLEVIPLGWQRMFLRLQAPGESIQLKLAELVWVKQPAMFVVERQKDRDFPVCTPLQRDLPGEVVRVFANGDDTRAVGNAARGHGIRGHDRPRGGRRRGFGPDYHGAERAVLDKFAGARMPHHAVRKCRYRDFHGFANSSFPHDPVKVCLKRRPHLREQRLPCPREGAFRPEDARYRAGVCLRQRRETRGQRLHGRVRAGPVLPLLHAQRGGGRHA